MQHFLRPLALCLPFVVLIAIAAGCGGGGASSSIAPTPAPTATPSPTPPPPSRFQPGVTGTRGDLPLLWQTTTGDSAYIVVTPDAGLPDNLKAARRIAAPDTYGDRVFSKWEVQGADFSTSSAVEVSEAGGGTLSLRAVYRPRTAGADGFQPNYSRPTFHYWERFPLKIHFDRAVFSPSDDALIRNGINQWTRASGGVLSYTVTENAGEADIEITAGTMPERQLGYTQVWWADSGAIDRAVVKFSNATLTGAGRSGLLTPVAAHEFGHALGIISKEETGHSDNPNDIMYQSIHPEIGVISERDMNVITNLYPAQLAATSRAARRPLVRGAGTAIAE